LSVALFLNDTFSRGSGAADSYITSCQHEYHKKCIESHFKKSENCPVCLVPCRPAGPQTRAKGLILEEVLTEREVRQANAILRGRVVGNMWSGDCSRLFQIS